MDFSTIILRDVNECINIEYSEGICIGYIDATRGYVIYFSHRQGSLRRHKVYISRFCVIRA